MLITNSQIEANLRRSAKKGYISLLNQEQLEKLALTYFGIRDENDNVIGYQCPYSGKIYTDSENIVLEHIIPIDSKGGTVLFNCIPTSEEVNKASEKGAKHLISWWFRSKYWDSLAPMRLEKLVNYILDGYNLVFDEYSVEEVENSYLNINSEARILEEEDDLEYGENLESQMLRKQGQENGIHSYLGFLLNCIETLEKCSIDTTKINDKLNLLEEKNIFENIEKFQLFQNMIQRIIVSRIGEDNHSYLTYLLKFNTKKIMNSINSNNAEEIYNELNLRLINIENILSQNNLSIIEYFKSVGYITDTDIIYKNISDITEQDKSMFLENIKLGIDSKINIFINMLNEGNSNILGHRYVEEKFEGYDIKVGTFWRANDNKRLIIDRLFEELKNNDNYDNARMIILNYLKVNTIEEYYQKEIEKQEYKSSLSPEEIEFQTNITLRINNFIAMLNKGNINILKTTNIEVFEGYENTSVGTFYVIHKEKIIKILFEELKDDQKYDVARQTILLNEKVNTIEEFHEKEKIKQEILINLSADELEFRRDFALRLNSFINMLNKGNSAILNGKNVILFEGCKNTYVGAFYQSNKEIIIKKLFEELKDDPQYDVARQLINYHLFDSNKKIEVFINMLNKGNTEILKANNTVGFEGYENIIVGQFWHANSNRKQIIKKLFEELKNDPQYDVARQNVLTHFKVNTIEGYYQQESEKQQFIDNLPEEEIRFRKSLTLRIDNFINMLNKGNSNILNGKNTEMFEGFSHTPVGQFWTSNNNKQIILDKLFVELKDDPRYDVARHVINESEFRKDKGQRVSTFIDMLNKGNDRILNKRNTEMFEGYDNIPVGTFWALNKKIITTKLFEELKDNPQYDVARQTFLGYFKVDTIDEYRQQEKIKQESKNDLSEEEIEFQNNLSKRIDVFIEMLNNENVEILKQANKITFDGYKNTPVGAFWSSHKDKIKQKLFVELKDNKEYEKARETVLTYFKVTSYEELEEKERKKQQLKELSKMKKTLEETDKSLTEENIEHRKRA